MPASASDLAKGIEPGSIPQGDRAGLEQGLAGLGGGGDPAANPGVAPAAAAAPSGGDPLSALISGDIQPPGGGDPLTEGLSVGPGGGPQEEPEDPRMTKLRDMALQASSPLMRAHARNELRRIVREAL